MKLSLLMTCLVALGAAADPCEDLYLEGVDLVSVGRHDQAAEKFQQAVEGFPDGQYAPSALLMWADTERKRGEDERAAELYGQLARQYPTHRLARTATTRRQVLEERNQDDATAAYWAILESYTDRQPRESIEQMEALVAANPEHGMMVEAQCWLAGQYRLLGDDEAARWHYENALARTPQAECNLRGLQFIAVTAMDRGELDTARDAIQRMMPLGEPGREAYTHHLATLVEVRRHKRIGQVLVAGSLLAAPLLLLGLRRRRPGRRDLVVAIALGVLVAGALLATALLGGQSARAPLLVLTPCLGALAALSGLLRRTPRARWHRWAYPAAVSWLAGSVVYGALFYLDRL